MPDRYWPLHRVAGQEDVWVARDEATGEEVVMKRMERETNSDYEELNQQIIQEAHTHKELAEACPERIIGYRNFYLDDEGYYCLIMDRADCTVSDLLQMRGCLAEQDAQVLVHALLEGLEFMHKRYILHRDLKPSNLFLVDRQDLNSLRLADFGISAEENGYSNVGGVKGTNGYMAPEVLKKTLYGRPVDMWSTGIITYQILRGRLPWIGNPSRPSERLVHSNIMKEDGLTDDVI
ncbi:hypothetical protein HK405_000005 [Cladochytrium tenue]|nr:hypothetical protein HK405_000005 [Cladochytrium tenue]